MSHFVFAIVAAASLLTLGVMHWRLRQAATRNLELMKAAHKEVETWLDSRR